MDEWFVIIDLQVDSTEKQHVFLICYLNLTSVCRFCFKNMTVASMKQEWFEGFVTLKSHTMRKDYLW